METQAIKTTETKVKREYLTIKDFCKQNGFVSINPYVLRTKGNNYPYIMFKTADPRDQVVIVCFSKGASASVAVGQPVTKQILTTFMVDENCKNAGGEDRIKLVRGSDLNIEDLLGE